MSMMPGNLLFRFFFFFKQKSAYEMARVKPSDIDVAEVHDSFSITEILNYEDLGFARPGRGMKLLKDEETALGGKIPVNIDGGLITKGYRVRLTGATPVRVD